MNSFAAAVTPGRVAQQDIAFVTARAPPSSNCVHRTAEARSLPPPQCATQRTLFRFVVSSSRRSGENVPPPIRYLVFNQTSECPNACRKRSRTRVHVMLCHAGAYPRSYELRTRGVRTAAPSVRVARTVYDALLDAQAFAVDEPPAFRQTSPEAGRQPQKVVAEAGRVSREAVVVAHVIR